MVSAEDGWVRSGPLVDLQQQYALPLLRELYSDAACVGRLAHSALAADKDPFEALLLDNGLQCRVEGIAFRFGADEFDVGRHRFRGVRLRAAILRSSASIPAGEATAGVSGGRETRGAGRREISTRAMKSDPGLHQPCSHVHTCQAPYCCPQLQISAASGSTPRYPPSSAVDVGRNRTLALPRMLAEPQAATLSYRR